MQQESDFDAVLKWTFNQNITDDFEISLQSKKNPIVLLRRTAGVVYVEKDTEYGDRVQLASDEGNVIALKITSATIADSGNFSVDIPRKKFFNSQATLLIKGTRHLI